jgi:L-methionine (R)-S-oxide reductase
MKGHQELLLQFEQLVDAGTPSGKAMQHISDRLHTELLRYNWIGFYLVDAAHPNSLLLGPHAGVFTPYIRISLDQGLCGAATRMGTTVVANDVSEDARYLMGSGQTKSEIVVPILVGGAVVAVFLISSFFKDTWNAEETTFVERCAALVSRRM